VDTKQEIRESLTSRRGRITPEQAGLASYGSRRVPGLRREEVAVLAGVSVPYYIRLERGDLSGVSDGVLEALARALELDDTERAHLLDLARSAQPTPVPRRRRQAKQRVRPEVQWTLDAITSAAAFVGNARLDLLAANQLGRALFSELYAAPARPVNTARFVFFDPRAEAFFGDWDRVANESAAILRAAAGRNPYNRDLSDLVGELATQSEAWDRRLGRRCVVRRGAAAVASDVRAWVGSITGAAARARVHGMRFTRRPRCRRSASSSGRLNSSWGSKQPARALSRRAGSSKASASTRVAAAVTR
jgi:transcriptional regulator with XRE-family HTH domain